MHAAQLKPNTSHSMKVIATDPTGGLLLRSATAAVLFFSRCRRTGRPDAGLESLTSALIRSGTLGCTPECRPPVGSVAMTFMEWLVFGLS